MKRRNPSTKKNLLIIHQGALGDLVVSFPSVIQLKNFFHPIDVICQSSSGKLGCALGVFSKFYPLESASFSSLYSNSIDSRIKNILRSYQEIVLFSFSKLLEDAIAEITTKKPHRIMPRSELNQKLHVGEYITRNLRKCGLLEANSRINENVFLPVNPAQQWERINKSKRILIHPGSGSKKKFWPILNFIKTEAALRSAGLQPEFILGPAERFLARELKANGYENSGVNIISEPDELLLLLEKAGGFIGNDSGVTHLAAFSGLPTVAVFGPSDPERWKPIGPSVEILRPELKCSPCFEKTEPCAEMSCFNKTTPEMVVNAFYTCRRKLTNLS